VNPRSTLVRFLAGIALLLAIVGIAAAQEAPPRKRIKVVWEEKQVLRVSVSFREVVDAATTKKLQSGLPTTIVTTFGVFREADAQPFAGIRKTCVVTFDLWDDLYHIKINGAPDDFVALSLDGVLRRCTDLDIAAPRAALSVPGRYLVRAQALVNPLSPDMIERIKRWVSRPVGTNVAAGDALFGSFVDLFVTRGIGDADNILEFKEGFAL
jgi:hypothetical protein